MRLARHVRSVLRFTKERCHHFKRWLASTRIWDWLCAQEPTLGRRRRRAGPQVEVLEARECPTITITSPANYHTFFNETGDIVSEQVSATDTDNDPMTWVPSGAFPSGLSMNSSTGAITGTIDTNAAGDYEISVGVGDYISDYDEITIYWHVNGPPTIDEEIEDQESDEGDPILLQVVASDPNELDELTYSATGLPAGLTINASTGEIAGNIAYSAAETNGGIYEVEVTVTDPNDKSDVIEFEWTIYNAAEDTSIALESSKNPSGLSEMVTFTATVSADYGEPTGSVEFFADGVSIGSDDLLDGVGSTSTDALTFGVHEIVVVYTSDDTGHFSNSISYPLMQEVYEQLTVMPSVVSPPPVCPVCPTNQVVASNAVSDVASKVGALVA